MTIRTRFAPSPTGYLHVGGARTALYNWLYARHLGGQFILRIEDTDIERSTPEAVQAILDGMAWLGLAADEGPFYQTAHMPRYRAVIDELLAAGSAYRCVCSKARLDALREQQIASKEKPRYDGHCRDQEKIDATQPHVIRFKNPLSGEVLIDDLVLGAVVIRNEELDDFIIARTDGSPTYNFCVVVDDMDMAITHVIRGNDHLNNTPRQINLFHALGVTPPRYGHLPMILGDDGQKLSKRHGAVSVMEYRDEGYLPQALLNYLVRLGWSHGDQELFTLAEMVRYFEITAVNKSAAAFNTEKLRWLNHHYLLNEDPASYADELSWHIQRLGYDPSMGPELTEVISVFRERAYTLKEMAEKAAFCYVTPMTYEEAAYRKHMTPDIIPALTACREAFAGMGTWTAPAIHEALQHMMTQFGLKLPQLAQPLRIAMTGSTTSPSIDLTLALLGQSTTVSRLDALLAVVGAEG